MFLRSTHIPFRQYMRYMDNTGSKCHTVYGQRAVKPLHMGAACSTQAGMAYELAGGYTVWVMRVCALTSAHETVHQL